MVLTTTTALYNKTAIKRAKDNSPFLGFTIFLKKSTYINNNKIEIPFTADDNTFLIQSPTALVESDFKGEMMSSAKPNLFNRSNVDLKEKNNRCNPNKYIQ